MGWYLDGGPTMHILTVVGLLAAVWAVVRTRGRSWRMWVDVAVAWAAALVSVATSASAMGLIIAFSAVAKVEPAAKQQLLAAGVEVAQRPLIWAGLWCLLLVALLVGTQVAAPPDPEEGRGSWGARAVGMLVLAGTGFLPPLALGVAWGSFGAVVSGAASADVASRALSIAAGTGLLVAPGCAIYGVGRVVAGLLARRRQGRV